MADLRIKAGLKPGDAIRKYDGRTASESDELLAKVASNGRNLQGHRFTVAEDFKRHGVSSWASYARNG
jgi:S1-C subfamily serine protease